MSENALWTALRTIFRPKMHWIAECCVYNLKKFFRPQWEGRPISTLLASVPSVAVMRTTACRILQSVCCRYLSGKSQHWVPSGENNDQDFWNKFQINNKQLSAVLRTHSRRSLKNVKLTSWTKFPSPATHCVWNDNLSFQTQCVAGDIDNPVFS